MRELPLKNKFERGLLVLVEDLVDATTTSSSFYLDKAREYVQKSREMKFNMIDEYDGLVKPGDISKRAAFIRWLDEARLQSRNILTERLSQLGSSGKSLFPLAR